MGAVRGGRGDRHEPCHPGKGSRTAACPPETWFAGRYTGAARAAYQVITVGVLRPVRASISASCVASATSGCITSAVARSSRAGSGS